jgi:P4 family phage/plasmid primase-like protien
MEVKTRNINLKLIKKTLMDPKKFRDSDYVNKACYSQEYKKYGCMENWEIALNALDNLPDRENIFNELILDCHKVKPYLDIEWLKENFQDYDPHDIKKEIQRSLIEIFSKKFNYDLDKNDIYFSSCHRRKNGNFKYSFHVVVSTHPSVVFINTKYALSLAKTLQEYVSFDKSLIDTSVYKKTQNIRLPGQSKDGEFVPFQVLDVSASPLEYIITNIDTNHINLDVPEQEDNLFKEIQNVDAVDDKNLQTIIDKIKLIHPSSVYEHTDSNGFVQFNYTDRSEKCFTSDIQKKDIFHDKIGFYAYIFKCNIYIGCHSSRCNDTSHGGKEKKITLLVSNIEPEKNLSFEKVDYTNKFPQISPWDIKTYILNGARGISDLFEEMYLNPKRIKWINDTKNGSSYFWDGKLWQEDDYGFIERLLVTTVVTVLRDFIKSNETNEESTINISTIKETQKTISKLNDGINTNNIFKFIRPLIRDSDFSKIKDIHPYLLSCKNGMVDLVTGELRLSVPEDNITKSLEIDYIPDANDSEFDEFVKQITSTEKGLSEDLYNFFRWCIGYSMQGSPKKKIFIILYGPHGFNGKSLVMNTIKDILEFYAISMDSSVVLDNGTKKTAGSHSTELCQLENCRLGLLSDTKEDACIDDGRIKQLTGITDKISGREIYGKQKEFTPTFVPFISTNHPIQINLTDQAMYERLVLFPFRLSFVDNPVEDYQRHNDPSLSEKFKNNKEGILKWLIQCSLYYNQNQDKPPPDIINKAKEKYNKQVNPYIDFLDTTFIITNNPNDSVKRIDLIESYKSYTASYRMKCKPKTDEREFSKILKLIDGKKGGKIFIGLKYKDDNEDIDELM